MLTSAPDPPTRMIRDNASPNQIIEFVGRAESALAQVERIFLVGG